MKKFLTVVVALTIISYVSNVSTFAQSRGTGQGSSVSGGHGPDINHDTSAQGKSADHANTTHSQTSSTNETKLIDRINTDTKFRDRLNALMPMGSTITLADAAKEFKNEGQFIAFLHVSKNLGLTLDQWNMLRTKMTTGESLGKALHDVDPKLSNAQINVQVETAEKQAKEDQKTNKHS